MFRSIFLAVFLCSSAGTALAHKPSVQECREAGEFIRNAALSRDNGLKREAFMDQLRGDLIAIQSHPPEQRWFAQDADDEAFLVAAVEKVFDFPVKSTEHESDMVRACLARIDPSFKSL
jgi:hypothetical protein